MLLTINLGWLDHQRPIRYLYLSNTPEVLKEMNSLLDKLPM
jgi:hypothetical protein